ncbi:MAG: hypothetical protein GX957_10555, partial [Clostridiaceae bacterium]|nr:hypothetical protein [Clostridiaceae bacterium]
MAKPVYRIQIGAKGGARWGGSQIRKELDAYFKNGYKVKVTVGDVELKGLQAVIKTQKAINKHLDDEYNK